MYSEIFLGVFYIGLTFGYLLGANDSNEDKEPLAAPINKAPPRRKPLIFTE